MTSLFNPTWQALSCLSAARGHKLGRDGSRFLSVMNIGKKTAVSITVASDRKKKHKKSNEGCNGLRAVGPSSTADCRKPEKSLASAMPSLVGEMSCHLFDDAVFSFFFSDAIRHRWALGVQRRWPNSSCVILAHAVLGGHGLQVATTRRRHAPNEPPVCLCGLWALAV